MTGSLMRSGWNWRPGVPILKDAAAAFDCVVVQMIEAGTHTIFIGAIVAAVARDVPNLLYKQGNYAAL